MAKNATRKRPQRDVEVVTCESAFPVSKNPPRNRDDHADTTNNNKKKQTAILDYLNWNETYKQIQTLGSTGFEKAQKRNYKDEEYERLTGRKPKKQKIPLPIVRGLRKKAQAREARQLEQDRQAGIVQVVVVKKAKQPKAATSRIHGPAPSVGFVKNGVLRVKKEFSKKKR